MPGIDLLVDTRTAYVETDGVPAGEHEHLQDLRRQVEQLAFVAVDRPGPSHRRA